MRVISLRSPCAAESGHATTHSILNGVHKVEVTQQCGGNTDSRPVQASYQDFAMAVERPSEIQIALCEPFKG